ncbi:MAG: VWA domain-containing protein, partial [Acidobacteria bacterium]|nr:VWA domain-containing protein [Acidobacteriota bacterium]
MTRMMARLAIAACAAAYASGGGSPHQNVPEQSSEPPVFRSEANEVEAVVRVVDQHGNAISGLQRENFQILDNGKPQKIRSFRQQPATASQEPVPARNGMAATTPTIERRFIAIFFDDRHSPAGDFENVQKAAKHFVRENLDSRDRVGIFKASHNGEVTFTNDKAKLLAEIESLRPQPALTAGSGGCPRLDLYEAYAIVNNSDPSVLEVAKERVFDCECPPPHGSCERPSDYVLQSQAEAAAGALWNRERIEVQNTFFEISVTIGSLNTLPGRRMLILASSGFLGGTLEREIG